MYNSRLSFRQLVEALKKNLSAGNPGSQKLYGELLTKVESYPELLQPITDLTVLDKHKELVEMLLASIFPLTHSENENLFAVSFPFKYRTIYSSTLFKQLFLKPGSNEISVPNMQIGREFDAEKLAFAYNMILKKYCAYQGEPCSQTVYHYADPFSGLMKFLEVKIDARFVDVNPIGELPPIPDNAICPRTNRIMPLSQLKEILPLDKFVFEGLVVVSITDVTEKEVISEIKNELLHINAFSDVSIYDKLQAHMQTLLGLKDVSIGITPFFTINNHNVYSELHCNNSLIFRDHINEEQKNEIGKAWQELFKGTDVPVVFGDLKRDLAESKYLSLYYNQSYRSLLLCPLKKDGELIGLLEIVSTETGQLSNFHINKIEPAISLFTLALEKSAESLDTQIDRVIKDQFTAVQPSVEWKFTEAAMRYIVARQRNPDIKIERIAFEDVYPLYGAIDIRNSSTERSHAIQLDLIEQLQMSRTIVKKAQKEIFFPLLQEIEYKIDKYISSASDLLLSEDEIQIHDFLQRQIVGVFEHLQSAAPSLKKDIADYFSALDPYVKMIYHHRKDYEESLARINDTLSRFIDKEQAEAQKVFPHYFERYVTDGVEFNVYIGQSIAPRRKFDALYLRNMKMWQLEVLAKSARITKKLEAELSHPLSTTQLILAHSVPISISFRTAERKFDVDGAYNIRYEIIKKRIDKVCIKDTMERLTQPGKIAIVYSQPKEAAEYKEYIEFLQNKKLLKAGIEEFELEDLQGVVGLKALRVEANMNISPTEEKTPGVLIKTTAVSEN
jgi:hypothetical protein